MVKVGDDKDTTDAYEARLKDVTKTFVILLGISLFFFFLILVPYFSLRYDSETLVPAWSALTNTKKIILSLDKILNESKNIQNEYTVILTKNNNTHSEVVDYKKQLDKITFLVNNLKVSPDSPTIQNVLSDIQVDPLCNNRNFSNANWNDCNYNSKIVEERKAFLVLTYNKIPSMRASANSINKTTEYINNITEPVLQKVNEYKAISAQKVYLGTPIIIEDITPTLYNVKRAIIDYSNNLLPLYGNDTYVFQKICPDVDCTTQLKLPITNTTTLSELRSDLEGFRIDLIAKQGGVNDKLQKISSMFENFQTPVGTIPIGFQELVALFPFIISILFLFFVYSLSQVMQMRKALEEKNITTSSNESYIVRLLFDPTSEKKYKQRLQITLLLIPVLIFISSVVITVLIDFYFDKSTIDSDDPFRAAVGLNKIMYTSISIFAAVLMAISLWRLFHTSGNVDGVPPDKSSRNPIYWISEYLLDL
jgi:hypothetical protein